MIASRVSTFVSPFSADSAEQSTGSMPQIFAARPQKLLRRSQTSKVRRERRAKPTDKFLIVTGSGCSSGARSRVGSPQPGPNPGGRTLDRCYTRHSRMQQRTVHPVTCLVVLAAFVVNLGFAAGGAVLCRDSGGQSRIEFACDHGHCDTLVQVEHDHDADDLCRCSECPCDDSSLGTDTIATRKNDRPQARAVSGFLCMKWEAAPTVVLPTPARFVAPLRSPRVDPQTLQLRTIILIV